MDAWLSVLQTGAKAVSAPTVSDQVERVDESGLAVPTQDKRPLDYAQRLSERGSAE